MKVKGLLSYCDVMRLEFAHDNKIFDEFEFDVRSTILDVFNKKDPTHIIKEKLLKRLSIAPSTTRLSLLGDIISDLKKHFQENIIKYGLIDGSHYEYSVPIHEYPTDIKAYRCITSGYNVRIERFINDFVFIENCGAYSSLTAFYINCTFNDIAEGVAYAYLLPELSKLHLETKDTCNIEPILEFLNYNDIDSNSIDIGSVKDISISNFPPQKAIKSLKTFDELLSPQKATFILKMLEDLSITKNGKSILGPRKKSAFRAVIEAAREKAILPQDSLASLCNVIAQKIDLDLPAKLDKSATYEDFKKQAESYLKLNPLK